MEARWAPITMTEGPPASSGCAAASTSSYPSVCAHWWRWPHGRSDRMTGDYTKVPLRPDERWTGARMQQGRVLLDHDWNLNLDATARTAGDLTVDVVGAAGVPLGSNAFAVLSAAGGNLALGAGRMWVGGMEALAPEPFHYSDQDQIPAGPTGGRAIVYLDVFEQHVQPAENPELIDPALAPVDAAARTRTGWRVRVAATQ